MERMMSVEEAIAFLEGEIDFWTNRIKGPVPSVIGATKIVLAELKALMECSSCTCDNSGSWAQK